MADKVELAVEAAPALQEGDRVDLGNFVLNLAYMVAEVVKDGGTAYQLADMQKGQSTEQRRVLVIITSGEAADVMYTELVKKQKEQELLQGAPEGPIQ